MIVSCVSYSLSQKVILWDMFTDLHFNCDCPVRSGVGILIVCFPVSTNFYWSQGQSRAKWITQAQGKITLCKMLTFAHHTLLAELNILMC